MQSPLRVSFKNIPVIDSAEELCLQEVEKLERFHDRITSCRVVISRPGKRHRKGNLYEVRVDLRVPGGEVVTTRTPPEHHEDEDLDVAIHEAFHKVRRQLEDLVRRQRMNVKKHEDSPQGEVLRMMPLEGYGFIRTPDGREIYFHKNSVLDGGYDTLEVGTSVSYLEEHGDDGAHATSIRPVSTR